MTEFQKIRQKIIFDVLDKFPDISTNGAAKIIYRDNPGFFDNQEHCRSIIRIYRGQHGDEHRRKGTKIKKYYKPLRNEI